MIKGKVLLQASMKRFTSMRVGGPADAAFFPEDWADLANLVRYARAHSVPTTVLGKGTNLIVTEKGYRGWMISLAQGFNRIRFDGTTAEAGAGVPIQRLVRAAAEQGLVGLENFWGIPGTLGGGDVTVCRERSNGKLARNESSGAVLR